MLTAVQPPQTAFQEYEAIPALSHSGMKDLAVSPFRFWHLWLNPNRPVRKETPETRLGTAVHCALLQPAEFSRLYACEYTPEDFDDPVDKCLVTMDDIRQWLKDKGLPSSGRTKHDLVTRALAADFTVPIFDVLKDQHEAGRIILKKDEMARVESAAAALRNESSLQPYLENGGPEVPLTVTCPQTGVQLKARIDWITPVAMLDIKTFTQQRGKSIDQCVADAIWYERYFRQAWLYSYIEAIHSGRDKRSGAQNSLDFILAFVESEEPHEVRLRALMPRIGGEINVYWQHAMHECMGLIRMYADCVKRYGSKPWRDWQRIDPLTDEDMRQLAWA